MEIAIVVAVAIASGAYAYPRLAQIRMQERLVQIQIEALTPSTGGGVSGGDQAEIDFSISGPYS